MLINPDMCLKNSVRTFLCLFCAYATFIHEAPGHFNQNTYMHAYIYKLYFYIKKSNILSSINRYFCIMTLLTSFLWQLNHFPLKFSLLWCIFFYLIKKKTELNSIHTTTMKTYFTVCLLLVTHYFSVLVTCTYYINNNKLCIIAHNLKPNPHPNPVTIK